MIPTGFSVGKTHVTSDCETKESYKVIMSILFLHGIVAKTLDTVVWPGLFFDTQMQCLIFVSLTSKKVV